ncbi:MAG: sigma-70 family RNA polymerase sigma factor [Pseudomonadota bacterium]
MADPALSTFVNERERLIGIALQMVKSRAIAEELVQDSWLRWDKKAYPSEKALPIFKRIVTNLALDWSRSRQTEEQTLSELMLFEDVEFDSERVLIARQELARVVRALEKLPKRTVAAFHMRFVDGLTFADIGKRLEMSRSRAHGLVEETIIAITCVLSD